MNDLDSPKSRPKDIVGRALFQASYLSAILGGFIMSGLAIMVVVSVSGRWTISLPIFGDFEMVAFGTAISVFLFLPLCHMMRGNVIVDLFLSWAPARFQRFCDMMGSLLLALIAATLTWRMSLGMMDLYNYQDSTYILAIPLWWAFPFLMFGSGLLTLCCCYTVIRDLRGIVFRDRDFSDRDFRDIDSKGIAQ